MDEFYTNFDDAQKRLHHWMRKANKQPVIILKDEKVVGVLVSHEEYCRFTRGDRKIISLSEMSPEDIEALEHEASFLPPQPSKPHKSRTRAKRDKKLH